jgi:hypothetical protein
MNSSARLGLSNSNNSIVGHEGAGSSKRLDIESLALTLPSTPIKITEYRNAIDDVNPAKNRKRRAEHLGQISWLEGTLNGVRFKL